MSLIRFREESTAKARAGFSLLEAMAAVALLSIGLVAFFAALSNTTQLTTRAADAALRARHEANLLSVAETINPMAAPTGAMAIAEDYVVRWESVAVTPLRPAVWFDGALNSFDVRLYEVRLSALRGETEIAVITVRRAGWNLARPTSLIPGG